MRKTTIDLFTSIIKEKKFIDTVEDLTIFVENKNQNFLENIIIKEKINDKQSQIIVAQNGEIVNNDKSNKIILINGKIINTKDNNQNIIDFTKFKLDLNKFTTNTITHPKTQEMNSLNLFKCIKEIREHKKIDKTDQDVSFFLGCNNKISPAIIEEFLKRFFAPIFIILIGLASSLIILTSKDENNYRVKNFLKFFLGIFLIILSEILMTHSGLNINNFLIFFLIPLTIFLTLYLYLFLNFKFLRRS